MSDKRTMKIFGGRGSGNAGHAGRPGQVGGSAKKYIEAALQRGDTMSNPFDSGTIAFLNDAKDDVDANVQLRDDTANRGEPSIYFDIFVPSRNRGKGLGTKVMKKLMEDADKHQVVLYGEPFPFGDGKKMTEKQLAR